MTVGWVSRFCVYNLENITSGGANHNWESQITSQVELKEDTFFLFHFYFCIVLDNSIVVTIQK